MDPIMNSNFGLSSYIGKDDLAAILYVVQGALIVGLAYKGYKAISQLQEERKSEIEKNAFIRKIALVALTILVTFSYLIAIPSNWMVVLAMISTFALPSMIAQLVYPNKKPSTFFGGFTH
jgi:cytochrome bd-type quinol oxidase subunit 2